MQIYGPAYGLTTPPVQSDAASGSRYRQNILRSTGAKPYTSGNKIKYKFCNCTDNSHKNSILLPQKPAGPFLFCTFADNP